MPMRIRVTDDAAADEPRRAEAQHHERHPTGPHPRPGEARRLPPPPALLPHPSTTAASAATAVENTAPSASYFGS